MIDSAVPWADTLETMIRTIAPDVSADIGPDTRLREDLHLHSLAVVELALGLEEVLELQEMDFEEMSSVATVGDLSDNLRAAVEAHRGVLPQRSALDHWVAGYSA